MKLDDRVKQLLLQDNYFTHQFTTFFSVMFFTVFTQLLGKRNAFYTLPGRHTNRYFLPIFVGDLNKRNNQIRELLKKMKSIENEAVETSSALNTTRHQLQTVIEQHTAVCQQLKDIEVYTE